MRHVQYSARPTNFRKSWQYQKILDLHGQRLATLCVATFWWILDEAAGVDVVLPEAVAIGCAEGVHIRVKRRVLWALVQANLLRVVEGGYRVWCLAEPPPTVRTRQPTEQMTLGLVASQPGSRSRMEPERPVLDPDALAAEVEKVEQNQASQVARAVALTSTEGDDAPPIDRASPDTEFLQATAGAQAPGCLVLQPLRAQAKKQSNDGGPLKPFGGSQHRAAGGQAKQTLQPLSSLLEQLLPNVSEVARAIEPPRRIIEGPNLTHPVNTQRVKKQQKLVLCREPSSTAVPRDRMEVDLTPPPLYPTAAQVTAETAKTWPTNPAKGQLAERIVQMQTSWSELRAALDIIERDMARGVYKNPPVLINILGDVRDARKAQEVAPKRPQSTHVHRTSGDRCTTRQALADAINAYLGMGLRMHHCMAEPYLDAMEGRAVADIVAIYADVCDQPPDEDFRGKWALTSEAIAMGKNPTRAGRLPPPNDENHVRNMLAKMLGEPIRDVQFPVDKSAQAG